PAAEIMHPPPAAEIAQGAEDAPVAADITDGGGAHPVHVHQADVAQRHRSLLHEQELVGVAAVGRAGGVDDDVDREVLFFEKELEKEAVEAAVDVPVDVADVITDDVRPVIGKLDALPPLLAATLPLHAARK